MLRSFLSPTKRLSHYCSQEGCSQYDWTATTGALLHGIIVPACLFNIHTHTHKQSVHYHVGRFYDFASGFSHTSGTQFPHAVAERRLHYYTECFVLCGGDGKKGMKLILHATGRRAHVRSFTDHFFALSVVCVCGGLRVSFSTDGEQWNDDFGWFKCASNI